MLDPSRAEIDAAVVQLRDRPVKVAVAVSGAGAGVQQLLWRTAGISKILIECALPYAEAAFDAYVGRKLRHGHGHADAAVALAAAAYHRLQSAVVGQYGLGATSDLVGCQLIGVGATAAVQTTRERKGADRVHLAVKTGTGVFTASVELEKGRHSREQQGHLVDLLTLNALLWAAGVDQISLGDWGLQSDQLLVVAVAPDSSRPHASEGRVSGHTASSCSPDGGHDEVAKSPLDSQTGLSSSSLEAMGDVKSPLGGHQRRIVVPLPLRGLGCALNALRPDCALAVDPDGTVMRADEWSLVRSKTDAVGPHCRDDRLLLLPGAFRPLHFGHEQMADIMGHVLGGRQVLFELGTANADKGTTDVAELQQRLVQFRGRRSVIVTAHCPRFIDKARLLACDFILGADTAARVMDGKYCDDGQSVDGLVDEFRKLGCKFYCFGRADDATGTFRRASDHIPSKYADVFVDVPGRWNVSSTQLRAAAAPGATVH